MRPRASCAVGLPGPPPHPGVGLFRKGLASALAASRRGPLLLWEHCGRRHIWVLAYMHACCRGARRVQARATVALEPFGPPPHHGGGLLCSGIACTPLASRHVPPSCWTHWGPRRITSGDSVTLGLPGPLLHHDWGLFRTGILGAPAISGRGLFRSGIAKAPTALRHGPPLLWCHRGPRCLTAGASVPLDPLGPSPHHGGGPRGFGTFAAPDAFG